MHRIHSTNWRCCNRWSDFPVGDTDVTFTATDSHGNETSCAFVVTVNDVEAPVAVCQAVTVTLDVTGAASIVCLRSRWRIY